MTPHDVLASLARMLPTRQLRRVQARRLARVLRRAPGQVPPESLEPRSMMSTTTGDLATATTVATEPAAYTTTLVVPRTFTITWAWNENRTITDFNPAADRLSLDWFSGSELKLADEAGSAVLRIPAMQQSYRLEGVPLSRLTTANFTCKDSSATASIASVIAAAPQP